MNIVETVKNRLAAVDKLRAWNYGRGVGPKPSPAEKAWADQIALVPEWFLEQVRDLATEAEKVGEFQKSIRDLEHDLAAANKEVLLGGGLRDCSLKDLLHEVERRFSIAAGNASTALDRIAALEGLGRRVIRLDRDWDHAEFDSLVGEFKRLGVTP